MILNKPFLVAASVVVHAVVFQVKAQTPVSASEAVQIALQNSRSLSDARQTAAFHHQLTTAAFQRPAVEFSSEFGQINGPYFDFKIGVMRTIR